jgi:hypothetical protein
MLGDHVWPFFTSSIQISSYFGRREIVRTLQIAEVVIASASEAEVPGSRLARGYTSYILGKAIKEMLLGT